MERGGEREEEEKRPHSQSVEGGKKALPLFLQPALDDKGKNFVVAVNQCSSISCKIPFLGGGEGRTDTPTVLMTY